MNDLQNSILESISILAKSASQSAPATLTIEAVIIDTIDAGSGLYLVEYLGNKFKAYADASNKYTAGELVYVIIPNGDFTKNKIILRAVTPTVKNYVEDSSEKIYYNNTTGNLLDYSNEIQLSSYKNEVIDLSKEMGDALGKLKDSLKRYFSNRTKTFKLDLSVKTNILGQSYGNYGLILNIPSADGGMRSITLDRGDIIGNPYALNTWTPQSKIFTVESFDSSRNIELYAFVDGFIEDENQTIKDISFKDFKIYGVEVAAGSKKVDSYKLSLTATEGSLFLSESDKTLLPKLFINDKETALDNYDCYWFEEDALVTAFSKDYTIEGGIGWRCVNKKINVETDSQGYQYIEYNLNEPFYTILYTDFENIFSRRYKCVIDYDGILVSKVIEIKNYVNPPFVMDLYSSNQSTSFIKGSNINLTVELEIFNTELFTKNDLIYIWHRYDEEGNFIEKDFVEYIQQNSVETEVSFSSNKIDTLNTIRCFIYVLKNNKLQLLASDSINVTIATDMQYFATISPNNILYKYDSDGDSPLVADYDGPSPITAINPLQLHIYKQDGTELTESEYALANIVWYIDKNSLFKVVGVTPEKSDSEILEYINITSLPYTIETRFNKAKSENKLYVDIEIDGTYLNLEPNIQFIKEGESGINGSKYTALISYNKKPYNSFATKIGENLIFAKNGNNNWYYHTGTEWQIYNKDNLPKLSIEVFKNGSIINNGFEVEWNIFDYNNEQFIDEINDGKIILNQNSTTPAVVEAIVTLNEQSDTHTEEVIYCYYPIDIITYNNKKTPNEVLLPLISGGFNIVEYSQDGINPKYDTTKNFTLFCTYGNFDKITWTTSNKTALNYNNNETNTFVVSPINRYDSDMDNLTVKVNAIVSTKESSMEEPVVKNIEIYEKDKDYLLQLLNDSYNVYNSWCTNIKGCVELLKYREDMLLKIEQLKSILDNILLIREIPQVQDLQQKLNEKKEQVYNFSEKNFEDYKLFISYKISDIDTPVTKILGNDFNREIVFYNSICEKLVSYKNRDKEYEIYKNIKKPEINFPQSSNELEGSPYYAMKIQVQEMIGGMKYQISSNSLKEYFDTLLIILNNYGYLNISGEWKLNAKVEKWYSDEINKIEQEISDNEELYNCNTLYNNSRGMSITITKPIIFLYNRDELSTVQGWDGNKLYVNSDKTEYLTSLRAAVGTYSHSQPKTYNLRNSQPEAEPAGFSGVALGTHVKIEKENKSKEQGIYGYYNGQQTFMLNATNGVASFGVSGQGQIILDPSEKKAVIRSGNYDTDKKTGMMIDLTTPGISFGSGKFIVDSEGKVTATDVNLAGAITATEGVFKGKLEGATGDFSGKITATEGSFEGKITATEGSFGNLKIATKDGKPYITVTVEEQEKPFIGTDGLATINFADKGIVYTSEESNIGGWLVVEESLKQKLQGTGEPALILDPQNNNIYHKGISIDNSFGNIFGFYLGKEGFNIPNAIQIKPNATDGQRWTLDSQNLQWYSTGEGQNSSIKIGANGINLLNKIIINNEDNVFISGNQISVKAPNGVILRDDTDSVALELSTNGLNILKSDFAIKVGTKPVLKAATSNNLVTLSSDADIINLKNKLTINDKVQIAADTEVTGSIKASGAAQAQSLTIGSVTFTEEDFIKLKALLEKN